MTALPNEVPSLHYFLRHAAHEINSPDSVFLMRKQDNQYHDITYQQALDKTHAVAAYFMNAGLQKGDKVAMIIDNCPEYLYFDQAMMMLGLVNVSIYPTLPPKEIAFILQDSKSKMILTGSPFLNKKVLKIKAECPDLQTVITAFEPEQSTDYMLTLQEVFDQGEALYPKLKDQIEASLEQVTRDDLASFIYTSGTTGTPKGTMLTHGNFISNAIMAIQLIPQVNKDYRFLSFLPLCHVYERLATYYLSTYIGSEIAFAQSIDTIATNVNEVQPTILITVPRLLERIEEKVRKNATAAGGVKAKIFNWALKTGEKERKKREAGTKAGPLLAWQHRTAEKLVFSKIKEKLGGRLRMIVSGGGALPVHVGEFFANIGIRTCEGYGLTETSPFICVNEFERQVFGTVGRIAPQQEVALQNPDTQEIIATQTYDSFDPSFESEEGEILVKGPHIMQGYWNNESETNAVFDAEGWFHTGDVGRFHQGNLKITDRIKNMLVNAFGKNIYPTPVENTYLKSTRIEQIFLIGDQRDYVTALIVPSQEEMKEVFGHGEDYFAQEDPFITDADVVNWIEEDIRKLSPQLAKYERVKQFLVKRHPFTVDSGELTPTQKTKRKVILPRYEKEIEAMYGGAQTA